MFLLSLHPSFYLFALGERRISSSQKRVVSEPIRSNCRGCCCANPERVDLLYTCVLLRKKLAFCIKHNVVLLAAPVFFVFFIFDLSPVLRCSQCPGCYSECVSACFVIDSHVFLAVTGNTDSKRAR